MFTSRSKDSTDVRDIGLGDATDETIASHAKTNLMAIVTRDGDFGDIRNYPPSEYAGIVVIDVPDDYTAAQIVAVLAAFLDASPEIDLNKKLVILEPSRVRIRTG
jgi:predicted nuclease of predicted toxin-antitoxin system